jgi:hypothetical protein
MIPPAFMRLRLTNRNSGWPTLWLPLFLLWPLLLVVFVLASTAAIVLLALSGQGSAPAAFRACVGAYRVLCATRGSHVDVVGPNAQVLIAIY